MRLLAPALLLLAFTACKDRPKFIPPPDAGPLCEGNQQLIDGACRFVCQRDGDCMAGERCNLFTGQCVPKPPPPDAGPPPGTCTEGAIRCSQDKKSIETCQSNATWQTTSTCPPPSGFCQNEKCLVCQPGVGTCATMTTLNVCLDDGSATRTVTCSGSATCQSNECRECAPNTYRCNPANTAVQHCEKTGDETSTWKWVSVGDNFDGNCITQQCRSGGVNGFECTPPACFPGQIQCMNLQVAQTCNATGAWTNMNCPSSAECQGGICVDECTDAVDAKSYFGCDYWTAVMDNGVSAASFKANTTTGIGTADSKYALVVTNQSVNPAQVTVTRYGNPMPTVVKSLTVPGRNDAATKGLVVIYLPWQSIGNDSDLSSVSGIQRYAYRLQSTKPVTVYQFSPLDAAAKTGSCNNINQCRNEAGTECLANVCNYYSFSNDASLLLPAHILGMSYVAMTPEHIMRRAAGGTSGAPLFCSTSNGCAVPQVLMLNGQVAIVGTENNTTVTVVRPTAKTKAGTGVVALQKGGPQQTFSINQYDVLQIATDTPADGGSSVNLECADDPFDQTCLPPFVPCRQLCRVDNTLTGTVITSDKPISVFGGSYCTFRNFNQAACDHVEEQLFPFVTWGKNFVGPRTPPLRLANGSFASAANAGPDYYQIVAGCPQSQCPNGTAITLSSPPTAADVLSPNRCNSGSVQANNCRLLGGQYVEFRSKTSFTITADQPIQVAQFFAGEDATRSTSTADAPDEGDPSMVLLPPIEQWRSNYTVLTAPGIRDNYIGLVVDTSKVQTVQIDGAGVTGTWSPVIGTTFQTLNATVGQGTHVVNVIPRAGVTQGAAAGVVVFGFDRYVSYGYTGGLDLQSIVTGINPGG